MQFSVSVWFMPQLLKFTQNERGRFFEGSALTSIARLTPAGNRMEHF